MIGSSIDKNRFYSCDRSGIGCQLLLAFLVCLVAVQIAVTPAAAQDRGSQSALSQEESCRVKFQEGVDYQNSRRLDQAREAFDEVRETCPDMIDAYLKLGLILVQLKEYMEAIDVYEDALDRDPENLDLKEAMAYALSSAGELEDAIELYLELYRARPENTSLLRNLAFVYKQQNMVPEAVTLYNRLIELGEEDPQLVSEAGRLALQNNLYLAAVGFYQKLYEYDPNNVSTLHILGGYYWKIKFFEQVIPYYDKILAIEPDHAQALTYHKILGECRRKTKDFDAAAEDSLWVLEHEPENASNYTMLARIYKDAKNHAKAIEIINRALKKWPNSAETYYWWGSALEVEGKALEAQKKYDEAINSFNKAKEKFQKVIDMNDLTYSGHAKKQLPRMDALIERTKMLIERSEQN